MQVFLPFRIIVSRSRSSNNYCYVPLSAKRVLLYFAKKVVRGRGFIINFGGFSGLFIIYNLEDVFIFYNGYLLLVNTNFRHKFDRPLMPWGQPC